VPAPVPTAMDDAFRAGSAGGPGGSGGSLPDDYVIMGMPKERPQWFWPAIGGGALVVLGLVVFLLAR